MSGHWAVITSQLIHGRQPENSFSTKSTELVLITKLPITRKNVQKHTKNNRKANKRAQVKKKNKT